jgi:cytidylate kinase
MNDELGKGLRRDQRPMVKKHIITIAGRPGSGKSTTAGLVAAALGYQHLSSGDMIRAIAKQHGLELLEANRAAEAGQLNMDEQVDKRLQEIGRTQDSLVIDSRMAWHWIPGSFKVYLNLDITTAAKRILQDMTPERLADEKVPNDPSEYAELLQSRLNSENHRYKKLYGADPGNLSQYDLVVDTATNNPEQVTKIVADAYQAWLTA